MNGKICMITGANSGIGKATASGLANIGATVVMVCRGPERDEVAQAEIRAESGNQNCRPSACRHIGVGIVHCAAGAAAQGR